MLSCWEKYRQDIGIFLFIKASSSLGIIKIEETAALNSPTTLSAQEL